MDLIKTIDRSLDEGRNEAWPERPLMSDIESSKIAGAELLAALRIGSRLQLLEDAHPAPRCMNVVPANVTI